MYRRSERCLKTRLAGTVRAFYGIRLTWHHDFTDDYRHCRIRNPRRARTVLPGALALGATHERAVFLTVVPAAKSGIMAGIVLGIGRAIGETMAVIMVAGNQARMPKGIFQGIRTLTANIVIEMGYATDLHREALIATGVVLFVFILIINTLFSILKRKEVH